MDIWIKIRSLFEKQSVDDASKGVESLGKKMEETGKKSEEIGQNTRKAFGAINAAKQVSEEGIVGLGHAIHNLAGQFPALESAIAPVGLSLAAFAAWKRVIDTVRESHERLEKNLRDTKFGNIEASIKSLERAYKNMTDSIDAALDSRKRLTDAEASRDDAQTAAALAKIDLDHAKAKLSLDPADTFAGRRLDLDTAQKKAAVSDAAALRKSDRELAALRDEAEAQQRAKDNAAEKIERFTEKLTQLSESFEELQHKVKDTSRWYDPLLKSMPIGAYYVASQKTTDNRMAENAQKYAPNFDKIAAAQEKSADKITEAVLAANEAERNLFSLGSKAEVNRISRGTLGTQSETEGYKFSGDAKQMEFDRQKEIDRLQKEIADKAEQMRREEQRKAESAEKVREADQRYRKAVREEDAARPGQTPQQAARQDEHNKQLKEAADKSKNEQSKTMQVVAFQMTEAAEEMRKLREQIKNLNYHN